MARRFLAASGKEQREVIIGGYMKKWGKSRNLIVAKNDISVREAVEILNKFTDKKLCVTLTVSGEEPGTWETMIEINKVTGYKLQGNGHKYELNFKDRKYLCDGEAFYMTDSEARAIYFMLTSDTVISGYSDIAMNMRKRFGCRTVLSELYNGELTVVEKTE